MRLDPRLKVAGPDTDDGSREQQQREVRRRRVRRQAAGGQYPGTGEARCAAGPGADPAGDRAGAEKAGRARQLDQTEIADREGQRVTNRRPGGAQGAVVQGEATARDGGRRERRAVADLTGLRDILTI